MRAVKLYGATLYRFLGATLEVHREMGCGRAQGEISQVSLSVKRHGIKLSYRRAFTFAVRYRPNSWIGFERPGKRSGWQT